MTDIDYDIYEDYSMEESILQTLKNVYRETEEIEKFNKKIREYTEKVDIKMLNIQHEIDMLRCEVEERGGE